MQLALPAPHHTETTDAALTNSQALNGIYFGALLDVYWEILAQLPAPHKAPSKGYFLLSGREKESAVTGNLMHGEQPKRFFYNNKKTVARPRFYP